MEEHKDESPTTVMTESSVSVKPRALVTDDARFIGSTLVGRLLTEGYAVTALDDLSHGELENLQQASLGDDFEFITAGVLEVDWDGLLGRSHPEVIFHLAAQVDARISVAGPVRGATLDIINTIKLADAVRGHGIRKVVFTSSGGSIYSTSEELPVSENVPVNPMNPYAVSRATGELYLNMFHNLYGLECSYITLANVYDPRQDPHGKAGVAAIFAQRLLAREPTKILGNGGNTRGCMYVDDVVDAFYRTSGEVGGGMRFSIDTGVGTSDRQLRSLVAQAANTEDNPEFAPPRTGDVARSALDPTRTREVLGWESAISVHEDAARIVEYFRNQG